MSNGFIVPADILEIQDLDVYTKMVYIVLSKFRNKERNDAFPSYETIARLGSMGLTSAKKAVRILVEKGLIIKQNRKRTTKHNRIANDSNLYLFCGRPTTDIPSPDDQRVSRQTTDIPSPDDHKQNNLTKSYEHKIINNNKGVVGKSPIQDVLLQKGIQLHPNTLRRWLELDTEENILLAIQEATRRVHIQNLIAYITRMLQSGYQPTVQRTHSAPMPSYIAEPTTTYETEDVTVEQKLEALELLLMLEEIDQETYDQKRQELAYKVS